MFSKYLLPNLSMPIKVPRLVSPVSSLSLHAMLPSFFYTIPMFYVADSRVSKGSSVANHGLGGHTCIWWPKSWEMLARTQCSDELAGRSDLQANAAQVAQGT
jgi:hypothetical protein